MYVFPTKTVLIELIGLLVVFSPVESFYLYVLKQPTYNLTELIALPIYGIRTCELIKLIGLLLVFAPVKSFCLYVFETINSYSHRVDWFAYSFRICETCLLHFSNKSLIYSSS